MRDDPPTNARMLGPRYLLYIVVGMSQMIVSRGAYAHRASKGSIMLGLVIGFESPLVVVPIFAPLALLDIAAGPKPETCAIAELLLSLKSWNVTIAALLFSLGSVIFTWLLLRGRLIPGPLAQLGIFASFLLVVALPLRLAELVSGSIINWLWAPMAAFEIPLGIWLIARGVNERS